MADPALVELAISADSDEAARARALRLLGFAADLPVRAVAVRSRLPPARIGDLICPARPVKAAPPADVGVILAGAVDMARFPAEVRAGIGAADSPDRSWREARTALRFTTASRPIVRYEELGASALLTQRSRRMPYETTPMSSRSPNSRASRRTWRPWTPIAPPIRCVGPPISCTCTTAASRVDWTRSARCSGSTSPRQPACSGPGLR
ncbi:hypothetical protein ABIA38_006506 [Embleya sp. AB8]